MKSFDKAFYFVFNDDVRKMTAMFNICLCAQRVNGQTSKWHRCACRTGVVGGTF
jgi:hypothetical protein